MKNPPKSILRQVRRNNVAILWDNLNEKLDLVPVPKRHRSSFYRSRKNQNSMNHAKVFMLNPRVNPTTGNILKKYDRTGKNLFNLNQ